MEILSVKPHTVQVTDRSGFWSRLKLFLSALRQKEMAGTKDLTDLNDHYLADIGISRQDLPGQLHDLRSMEFEREIFRRL